MLKSGGTIDVLRETVEICHVKSDDDPDRVAITMNGISNLVPRTSSKVQNPDYPNDDLGSSLNSPRQNRDVE